jgi:hypothetical protein
MKHLLILAAMALGCAGADIDGAKFTGKTIGSFAGESVFENGRIEGDKVSFTIHMKLQDNDVTVNYSGTLKSVSELKLTSEFVGADFKMDWAAKRK